MSEPQATIIRYKKPTDMNVAKTIVRCVRDEHMTVNIQVLREGGENSLHYHKNQDGLWFVLAGKATFYTKDDEVVGEFEAGEGVFIPRNFPYWFESSGDVPLELLQAEACDRTQGNSGGGRVDTAPAERRISTANNAHIDIET